MPIELINSFPLSGRSEYAPRTITCFLAETYLTLYKSLIRLDANLKIPVVSKRISHYSVVVGGMLLFWLWEAQLINYFTFPLNKLPFQNLEEFLSDSDKKVGMNITKYWSIGLFMIELNK